MTEYMSEIFKRINDAKNRKQKKEILESVTNNNIFKFILQGTFDPSIEWNVTKLPKYTPSNDRPIDLHELNLNECVPKCSIFVKGHKRSENINEAKTKELLTQILETMHEDESLIFSCMIKKKIKCK